MSITYLNEPFNFIAPDTNVVRASKAELAKKLVARETFYLPLVQHQLKNLNQLLYRVDDYVRDFLVSSPVTLQTQELLILLERMQEASNLEPKTLAASVADKYQAEISDILESNLAKVAEHAVTLKVLLDSLDAWSLAETASFITDQEQQRAAQQKVVDGLNKECVDLTARKQQINDAMTVYEEKTVFDRWTPILKDATRLKLSSPALATLQAGAIGVMHIFNIASEMVKYGDLVEARNHLQTILNDKHKQVEEQKKQIKVFSSRIEQLRDLQDIEEPKRRYEQEVRKLADALKTFITVLKPQAHVPVADYARAYITHADALAAWLQKVVQNWK